MNKDNIISHDEARVLTELFMAGVTTCADEKDLYTYYNGADVAPDLEQYRDMMRWYASGMTAAKPKRKMTRRVVRIWQMAGIAAMLAVVITAGIAYMDRQHELRETYAMYEGSYVIRDGKKITDLNEILPDIKRAEEFVAQYSDMTDADTEINHIYQELIDRQTEPAIREALRNILYN